MWSQNFCSKNALNFHDYSLFLMLMPNMTLILSKNEVLIAKTAKYGPNLHRNVNIFKKNDSGRLVSNIVLKLSLHILAAQAKSVHNRVERIWYKDIVVETRRVQKIAVVLKTQIFSVINNVEAPNV